MINKCNIVRDLLPLYVEHMASEDTKAFVDEHLAECAACRAELKQMNKPTEWKANDNTVPLKNLQKKLKRQKVQTILFTAAFVGAFVLCVIAALTTPQYVPYTDNLMQINEHGGDVAITFSDQVTDYSCTHYVDADSGTEVYHIDAWKTTWDSLFSSRKNPAIILPSSGKPIAVYYAQNNGADDVFIYGNNIVANGGIRTLPRYVLGYYLIFALLSVAILTILLLIFRRKEHIRDWIEKILLMPVSYILGHLFTKRGAIETYSAQRDFLLIIGAAILIYCILLFGFNLYRSKKERAEETLL